MNKYFRNIFVFLIPIFIIGFTVEFFVRKVPNSYSYKNSYLEKNANEIETLILGSSHTLFGIDPSYIEGKSFNASHVSQSLDFDSAIFNRFENNFDNLKTVIIRVSYSTLFSTLADGVEAWREKDYIIYYGIKNRNSIKYYSEVLSTKLRKNVSKLLKHYIKHNIELNVSELGWGNSYSSKNSKDINKTSLEAAKRHLGDSSHLKENIFILEELIKQCKANNIKVILITLPVHEEYRKKINKDQLSITLESAKNLASKNENCIYLNMFSDSTFTDIDFYDADHLNEIGAKKLSFKLNEKVKKLQ